MASKFPPEPREELPTDSQSAKLVYGVAILLPIVTVVVCLRTYTRRFVVRWMGVDDWMVLCCWVLCVAKGVCLCLMGEAGMGQHMWTLTSAQIRETYKRWYVATIVYYLALGSIKITLLVQYRRLFAAKIHMLINCVLAVVVAWSVAVMLLNVFVCWPIPYFWDKTLHGAYCIPRWQYIIHSVGNILSDMVIFALPLPLLWRLRAPHAQRLSLMAIFCLGFFTCVIACIRVVYLPIWPSDDDLYRQVSGALWSLAELCAAVIVTCLPVLRPLFFNFRANAAVNRGRAPRESTTGGSSSEPVVTHVCLRSWVLTGDNAGGDDGDEEAQHHRHHNYQQQWQRRRQQQQRRDFWVDKKQPRSEALPCGLHPKCRGPSSPTYGGGSWDDPGGPGSSTGNVSKSGSSSRTRCSMRTTTGPGVGRRRRRLSVTWASDLEDVIPAPPATRAYSNASASRVSEASVGEIHPPSSKGPA